MDSQARRPSWYAARRTVDTATSVNKQQPHPWRTARLSCRLVVLESGLGLESGLKSIFAGRGLGLGLENSGLGLALGLDCCWTCYKSAELAWANSNSITNPETQGQAKLALVKVPVSKQVKRG